ncbi:hypothetical protein HK100_006155 [Physocladia obscura]|uniref:Uncharacterized protein n=1 Tax=Physocladia obscura TaxID=109957 RepID=A0AAD5SQQ8_9FUNG|nr:hypothetical protein HK100_006155 [Physocladia obscura]
MEKSTITGFPLYMHPRISVSRQINNSESYMNENALHSGSSNRAKSGGLIGSALNGKRNNLWNWGDAELKRLVAQSNDSAVAKSGNAQVPHSQHEKNNSERQITFSIVIRESEYEFEAPMKLNMLGCIV